MQVVKHSSSTTIVHRTKFRKQMNEADNEAATRALDALVNFETVKVGLLVMVMLM